MKTLTKAVIDREALKHNYNEFRRITSPTTDIMAVVKANGYGHGASEVAKIALLNGCSSLAVARFSEFQNLRESGVNAPVLLFGYCDPTYVDYLINNNGIASVGCIKLAQILSDTAVKLGAQLKVHLKVDTGMGRIGGHVDVDSTTTDVLKVATLPGLEVEGIYTHFANADSADKTHANLQFSIFTDILTKLKSNNFEVKYRHAANSAAAIDMPQTHLDLIRPGISQYGLYPSKDVNKNIIDLKPSMSLLSTVIQVKDVPAGFKVSYGSTYVTPKATKVAVVPIGYADGYNRLLSSKGSMIVGGYKAPIIGRVCMDLTMIDVGHISNIKVDDDVTVMGADGLEQITADDIADLTDTINYEVVSSITSRVTREYIN